ncbi:Gfo/Idh/MocA family protein [Anaerorhabdus sp.]|uniref:Gfo/Idh/MocA family protein n=1 Tax=Anaerorhabdus sp. TaxID=1872524 RepID=UPI002FC74B63
MKTYNIGVSGYGLMGKVHSQCYLLQLSNYPQDFLINLESLNTKELTLDNHLFKNQTTSFNDFLNSNLDLVDICTPNSAHYNQVQQTINKGINIYCEKPLCSTIEESISLVKQVSNSAILNQVALVYRFIPAFSIVRDVIELGQIGTPLHFSFTLRHASYLHRPKNNEWRTDKSQSGGGVIVDLGIHAFDIIRFMLGEFSTISVNSLTYSQDSETVKTTSDNDCDDYSSCYCTLKNHIFGTIELSKLCQSTQPEWVLEIFGSKGSIYADANNSNVVSITDSKNNTSITRDLTLSTYSKNLKSWLSSFPVAREIAPHIASIRSVLSSIHLNQRFDGVPTFYEALASQLIIESGLKSIKLNGNPVCIQQIEEVLDDK